MIEPHDRVWAASARLRSGKTMLQIGFESVCRRKTDGRAKAKPKRFMQIPEGSGAVLFAAASKIYTYKFAFTRKNA